MNQALSGDCGPVVDFSFKLHRHGERVTMAALDMIEKSCGKFARLAP
jgi:hypothetical protein